jgi:hypothetical protein
MKMDIGELLLKLADPSVPLQEKKDAFHDWRCLGYNPDAVHEFFSDSLFSPENTNYLDVMLKTDYRNFYEMVMSLDLANIDPRAYYIYWVLTYGNDSISENFLKEALEYDPDTICAIFPDIKEILFTE